MALENATAPYARATATQALPLGNAVAGVCAVLPYDFLSFLSLYGLQAEEVLTTYSLTLKADQLDGPALVRIAYDGVAGSGTSTLLVPSGSLAGMTFGIAGLPNDPNLTLRTLSEVPPPAAGKPRVRTNGS